eukprot:11173713-Lingulodinium_polyedra.AAC.1
MAPTPARAIAHARAGVGAIQRARAHCKTCVCERTHILMLTRAHIARRCGLYMKIVNGTKFQPEAYDSRQTSVGPS